MNIKRRTFLGGSILAPATFIKPENMSVRTYLENFFGITTVRGIFGNLFPSYTTVYKIVGYNYTSLNSFALPNDVVLDYTIGNTVKPIVGKIFAYDSLESARIRDTMIGQRVLECRTKHCKQGSWWARNPMFANNKKDIAKLWDAETDQPKTHRTGIVYCDDVEVIREL